MKITLLSRHFGIIMLGITLGIAALAGCASTTQPMTPAQIMAIACPPIRTAGLQLQALLLTLPQTANTIKAAQVLTAAEPAFQAVCTAGATVSVASVAQFSTTVLPAVSAVAASLPLTPQMQTQVQAGIVAAQIAVGTILATQSNIAAATAAGASAPAAAPVAPASTPLSGSALLPS